MRKKILFVSIALLLAVICSIKIVSSIEKPLVIAEMCKSERSTIPIEDNCYYDYIKIYNPNKR